MRIRKNIECLTTEELHDLREAFAGIYQLPESNPKSFTRIAGLHGLPSPSYCSHSSTSGFLSWHRAYLLELENALREIRCDVTIPFWDWNSTTNQGIPEACKSPTYTNRSGQTADNPLFRGPIAPSAGGGFTSRRSDINTVSFADLASSAAANQSELNFSNYAGTLNGFHGSVHVRFAGSMTNVAYAAFDPVFFLHHANVDRLWAAWQNISAGAMPSSELNATLQPFIRPYTNNWHIGSDFENTEDWNYAYRLWCFILPPFVWPTKPVFELPVDPRIFDSSRINLVMRSESMPMESIEVRVFINEKKANADTPLQDNPKFAGSIGIFGMGKAHGQSIRGNEPQTLKLNITDSLRKNIRDKDKAVTITMLPVAPGEKHFEHRKAETFTVEIEAF